MTESLVHSVQAIISKGTKEFKRYFTHCKISKEFREGTEIKQFKDVLPVESYSIKMADPYHTEIQYKVKAPSKPKHGDTKDLVDTNTIVKSPCVDAFNFGYISKKNSHIFTSLKKDGYDSQLISYFSECEKQKKPLSLPTAESSRLKTVPFPQKKEIIGTVFIVPDGNPNFLDFHEYDSMFFETLMTAICEKPLRYRILRMDLAVDTNSDLSPFLVSILKTKRYNSFGSTPYIFAESKDGQPLEGSVPKRSYKNSKTKTFSDKNKIQVDNLSRINTFYSGNIAARNSSLVLYNKKLQVSNTNDLKPWTYHFRAELKIRFNYEKDLVLTPELARSIIFSYNQKNGSRARSILFLYVLDQTIIFLHRITQKEFHRYWLVNMIRPLSWLAVYESNVGEALL